MKRNSTAWLWLLLLLYALFAAYWSEKLAESARYPFRNMLGVDTIQSYPVVRALIG